MTEPKSQAEYISTLAKLDGDIHRARTKSHEAINLYRRALQARDSAALAFELGGPRITQTDCIKAVSETHRRVATGELPSRRETRQMKYAADFNPRGRGFLDRRTGQVAHSTRSEPRTPPRVIPSMAQRALPVTVK